MKSRFYPRRLLAALGVACGITVLGGVFAGVFGGRGGFSWMLLHGLCGPLAPVVMHHSRLSPTNLLTALAFLGVLAARAMLPTRTVAVLAIAAAAGWVLVGWSTGV